MKTTPWTLALCLVASGCAALTNPPPATFHEPGAKLAALVPDAPRPSLRAAVDAFSLDDVRVLGTRALLDFRSERAVGRELDNAPTCGPLELRDVAKNERIWAIPREERCRDTLISLSPQLLVQGLRKDGGELRPHLLSYALDTGAPSAKVALTADALAVRSGSGVLLVTGEPGKRELSLRDGTTLVPRWTTPIQAKGAIVRVVEVGGSVLLFGDAVTAVERASGKSLGATAFGETETALEVKTSSDAAYATLITPAGKVRVVRVDGTGRLTWTKELTGTLEAVTPDAVLLAVDDAVTALRATNGEELWRTPLGGAVQGRGLLVPRAKETLLLASHTKGVTALDVSSGAVRFTASPFGERARGGLGDRLTRSGEDLVVLDCAAGVAGLDLTNEPHVRYALAVRSLPHAHREQRLQAALGAPDGRAAWDAAHRVFADGMAQSSAMNNLAVSTGGGFVMAGAQLSVSAASNLMIAAAGNYALMEESIAARRAQQAAVSVRQAELDDDSAFALRPISWATGRGLLVVRKRDGAYRELVMGPSDVYEDTFRPASVAALIPDAGLILTFAEGLDPSQWTDEPQRGPVQLVARSLLGYPLDEASLRPASEYEAASIVPAPGRAPAKPPAAAPIATQAPAPAPAPIATQAPAPAPAPKATTTAPPRAPETCRTRFDCKGGKVCRSGSCAAPNCQADRDCPAGRYCSLDGACEVLSR